MAKATLDFSGLDQLMQNVESMGRDVNDAAKAALEKTHEYVTGEIEQGMTALKINGKPVNWDRTGKTKQSLRMEAEIETSGDVLSVKTGFEWPSAAKYLAYGRGTPRAMKASPSLRNALDKKKQAAKVLEIQEKALEDFISEGFGK